MSETRNIAQEFAQVRSALSQDGSQTRPYYLDFRQINKPINEYGLDIFDEVPRHYKKFPSGARDILVSSQDLGYLIRNRGVPGGVKIMQDRVVINIDNHTQTKTMIDLFKHITSGDISYSHFSSGAYGAVGFNPTVTTSSGISTRSDICIKYFNHAFPFSHKRWEKSIATPPNKQPDKEGNAWNLSAVTGIGSYIALRYLEEAGIPVPTTYIGSSEILVQQFIDGYTIADIIDNYETLKANGELGEDDTTINGILDFGDKFKPRIEEVTKQVLTPLQGTYWNPDFEAFDINLGNIMITKKGLADPVNNYFVIDPIK